MEHLPETGGMVCMPLTLIDAAIWPQLSAMTLSDMRLLPPAHVYRYAIIGFKRFSIVCDPSLEYNRLKSFDLLTIDMHVPHGLHEERFTDLLWAFLIANESRISSLGDRLSRIFDLSTVHLSR